MCALCCVQLFCLGWPFLPEVAESTACSKAKRRMAADAVLDSMLRQTGALAFQTRLVT